MRHSLRLRMVLAAIASIAAALTLVGFVLVFLFERHIERRIADELASHMRQLVAAIEIADSGDLDVVGALADPRFEQPLSGLYWQATTANGARKQSRSLWDQTLPLDSAAPPLGAPHVSAVSGPGAGQSIVLERVIEIRGGASVHAVRLAVATWRAEIDRPVAQFRRELGWSLSLLALFLSIAAWVQISIGLRPLGELRRLLRRIRTGEDRRLSAEIATEVQPLVDEVNALLEAQERTIERARSRAADLAHGLKTPLTVLGTIAAEQRQAGQSSAAAEIEAMVSTMRRHVDRELVRARIAAIGRPSALVLRPEIDRLIATLRRMPRGEDLAWTVDVPSHAGIAMDRADFAELLGTLLDNARKWAKTRVRIAWLPQPAPVLRIEDDGPGVSVEKFSDIMKRGRRLDETREGSGLGLAIAADIVEAYGGTLTLGFSALGGLAIDIGISDNFGKPVPQTDEPTGPRQQAELIRGSAEPGRPPGRNARAANR